MWFQVLLVTSLTGRETESPTQSHMLSIPVAEPGIKGRQSDSRMDAPNPVLYRILQNVCWLSELAPGHTGLLCRVCARTKSLLTYCAKQYFK